MLETPSNIIRKNASYVSIHASHSAKHLSDQKYLYRRNKSNEAMVHNLF